MTECRTKSRPNEDSTYLSFDYNCRATEAARHGYYELIEDMFSKSTNVSLESIKFYGATNVTLEDLYLNLGHRKEDLIVRLVQLIVGVKGICQDQRKYFKTQVLRSFFGPIRLSFPIYA